MIIELTKQNSIMNHFIGELRDVNIQKDRMRFRRNLERIGEIIAYEISKTLRYTPIEIETPLGVAETTALIDYPVIISVVRAGIPFHQGFLAFFDEADSGFIGAFRHARKSGELEIHKKYEVTPDLDNKIVIVCDPMLATGKSLVLCCKDLLADYNIQELHIASIIASDEGVKHARAFLPEAKIWVGAIDAEMTSKSYIVPGMGDVGDLAFGERA